MTLQNETRMSPGYLVAAVAACVALTWLIGCTGAGNGKLHIKGRLVSDDAKGFIESLLQTKHNPCGYRRGSMDFVDCWPEIERRDLLLLSMGKVLKSASDKVATEVIVLDGMYSQGGRRASYRMLVIFSCNPDAPLLREKLTALGATYATQEQMAAMRPWAKAAVSSEDVAYRVYLHEKGVVMVSYWDGRRWQIRPQFLPAAVFDIEGTDMPRPIWAVLKLASVVFDETGECLREDGRWSIIALEE